MICLPLFQSPVLIDPLSVYGYAGGYMTSPFAPVDKQWIKKRVVGNSKNYFENKEKTARNRN